MIIRHPCTSCGVERVHRIADRVPRQCEYTFVDNDDGDLAIRDGLAANIFTSTLTFVSAPVRAFCRSARLRRSAVAKLSRSRGELPLANAGRLANFGSTSPLSSVGRFGTDEIDLGGDVGQVLFDRSAP